MSVESLLRVSSVRVDGLFGLFDHHVHLKLEDRVTILHGPNGVGKTMLLRMANELLVGKYEVFGQVPFQCFSLGFDDGSKIELIAGSGHAESESKSSITFVVELSQPGRQPERHMISTRDDVDARAEPIARDVPWLFPIVDGENASTGATGRCSALSSSSNTTVAMFVNGPEGSSDVRWRRNG